MSGGFLGDFAYGFDKTATPILQAQDKAQAQADAAIREKVASVDPDAELFQRQEDIKADEAQKKQKQDMEQFTTFMQQNGYGSSPAQPTAPTAPTDGSVAPPTPTITAPGAAPNMTPPGSAAPTPDTTGAAPTPDNDPFARMQKHTAVAAAADAAGLPHIAAAAKAAADMDKNEYEHNKDLATEAAKPVTSAEGINVGEQLGKDFDKHVSDVKEKSWYTTKNTDVSLADPDAQAKEQEIFETINAPLAQSFLEAQKEKYPNSKVSQTYPSIKNTTIKATQAIVTLTSDDQRITDADKATANQTLASTFKTMYGSPQNLQKAIDKDPNLKSVIDKITAANQEQPTSTTPASPATPVVQNGATATNPKTGEKQIYQNGIWQPIQAATQTPGQD